MTLQRKNIRPNLFIVGAMKSGTTSLHNYLDMHPDIYMSINKEPAYFVRELNLSKGEEWYLSNFAEVRDEKIIGESSTDYTKLPHYKGVANRIYEFNSDSRIIYIMRDPVQRSISHYWWDVKWSGETRGPLEAIKHSNWIINCSDYAMQIKPYMDTFGSDNVYITTLEELTADPGEVLSSIFSWLGVEAFNIDQSGLGKRHNVSDSHVKMLFGGKLPWLKDSILWRFMKQILPAKLRSTLVSRLSVGISKHNDIDDIENYLRPVMENRIEELEVLTGKGFDIWRKS